MKRLYTAAPIALLTLLLNTQGPASALTATTASAEHKVSSFGRLIANSAKGVAASMDSVGYCYRGVKRALKKAGVTLSGGSAFMAKSQLEDDDRFKKVPLTKVQKGDILVHGKSKAHPHGHIAVYLGNGKEASDHIAKLVTGRRYGGTTVFRPVAIAAPVEVAIAVTDAQSAVTAAESTTLAEVASETQSTPISVPDSVQEAAVIAVAATGNTSALQAAAAVADLSKTASVSDDFTAVLSKAFDFAHNSISGLFGALL